MRRVALGGAIAAVIAGCAAHTETVTLRGPAHAQTTTVETPSPPSTPGALIVATGSAPLRHTSCVAYYRTRALVRFRSGTGNIRRACLSWVRAPAHRGRWTLEPGLATRAAFRVCRLVDANGDTVAVYDDRAKGERIASAACVRLLSGGRWKNAAAAVP